MWARQALAMKSWTLPAALAERRLSGESGGCRGCARVQLRIQAASFVGDKPSRNSEGRRHRVPHGARGILKSRALTRSLEREPGCDVNVPWHDRFHPTTESRPGMKAR